MTDTTSWRQDDGTYVREHYDHDAGYWKDGEDIGVQIVDDQLWVSDGEDPAVLAKEVVTLRGERDEFHGHLAQICEMLGEVNDGKPDTGAVWEGVNAMLDYNNRLKLQMEAVKRQRNELSAQNEKLKAALLDFAETVDLLDGYTHPNIECAAVAEAMRCIANESYTTAP